MCSSLPSRKFLLFERYSFSYPFSSNFRIKFQLIPYKIPHLIARIFSVREVNSALHPSGVAKSSTSFGWGKGGKVTSAGWQVTLCDLIWHVISSSGVVISITNCYIRFTLLYFTWCHPYSNTKQQVSRIWNSLTGCVSTHSRCHLSAKRWRIFFWLSFPDVMFWTFYVCCML